VGDSAIPLDTHPGWERERDGCEALPRARRPRHLLPLEGARGAILLPDPYSFPTDAVRSGPAEVAPAVPVLRGLSSARTSSGSAAVFFADEERDGRRRRRPARRHRHRRRQARAPTMICVAS
jgi:hypothetical protein